MGHRFASEVSQAFQPDGFPSYRFRLEGLTYEYIRFSLE